MLKKPNPIPCPHEYIYLKSYILDYISCTIFERFTGHKYLLSVAHNITALLVYGRKGEGWRMRTAAVVVIVGPIQTRGGRVV